MSELVTSSEAARRLNVHVQTILRWRRTGKLKPIMRLPNSWLYKLSDIEQLASERTPPARCNGNN